MTNILKALRMLKGLSQEETAKEMGMGLVQYNTKENNPEQFTICEAKKLAEILGTHYSIFFEKEVSLKLTI